MNILVRKNNQERGPYTESELRERLKAGALSGSDLGQIEGESEWKPLSEILLASVLATEKSTEARATTPAGITTYSWVRQPKIIGGAVVLLLLIFGGINWLNKASEKRRENAIAARQTAAMEQAEKQAAAMLKQEQERAAQARQAQLDQVKQMMAMTEKAQRDYQEKQKQRLAEEEKARKAREQDQERQRQEALRREEEERQRAEVERKRQDEQRLAALQKAAAPTATPSLIGRGSAPWHDPQDAANYVLNGSVIWNIATGESAGTLTRWSGTPHLVENHPNLVLFHEKEKMTAGFTDSPPHLVSIGVEKANSPPIDNNASDHKTEAYMASDYRRMVIFENGDIWRGDFDWAKNDVVNKKRLTTNGLFSFGHTQAVLWYGNNLYLDAKFSEVKPIVKVDLLTGSLEEIPTYDVFTHRSNTADRVMFANPTGDLCFFPHGSVLNTYDARTGKAATVRASVEVKEHGRPVPIEVVTGYSKLEWIDSDTVLCIEGDRIEHPLVRINVRNGASTVLDDRPGHFAEASLLPGGHFADVLYRPRQIYGKTLPAEHYLIDVTNGTRTKLPFLPEMPRHWLNAELCIYAKTGGGVNEVGTWLFNRATNQVKKLCSTPCDKTFAKLLPNGGEVCFSATVNGQHLCRVKLNGEDFSQLPCGEYVEAMAAPPVDLGLNPDSKPLWQPVSAAPQQQSAENEAQQQTAARVATQREAAEATPQQQPAEVKPQQPGAGKSGDWITVMDAIKNEPPEMQEWAKKAYDYATGNIFLNDFYDPAKLTLKFLSAHRARPEASITDIVSKTDYKECVSRQKVEQWAYLRTYQVMNNLPPAQLEKVASEVGRLVADAYVANPVPSAPYKERLFNNAIAHARHTLDGARQKAAESTPPAGETTGISQANASAKRPAPNPNPVAVAYADPKIQMENLGPMPKDLKEVAVSSDGLHVAAVIPSDGGQVVYYDGKPGPQYDNVAHFMSGRSPAVVFNKDGTHAAYLAVRGESQFVWADGKETALTSRFRNSGDARSITLGPDAAYFKFSPGGEHLAYACDTDAFQREIVVDGAEGRAFHSLYPILFSERGGHYAYVGKPNQTESLVVVDGTPGPVFSDIRVDSLRLSPDGTHCAYISTKETSGNSWFVVLDGNEQHSYDNIEFLQFSSTGHCAYVGAGSLGDGAAYGSTIVVDGKQVAEYRDDGRGRNVEQLQFSPDGNRLAHVAKTPDGVAVFVDGKRGHSYDAIDPNSLQFSHDSSSLTYYGKRGSDRFVVTDGRESPPVGKVFKFTYAEKANMAAFIAAKEPGGIAVVDNQPSKNYRFCHDIALSPDGSRHAYAMSGSIGHPDVVVDGHGVNLNPASFEEPAWGTDLKSVFRFSPDSRHLAMAGMGPDGIGQIISVDGGAGPHVGACQRFVFSRDSAHFAYLDLEAGPKGTTTKIMLDHKPVQTFGPQLAMMVFAAARERARELPPPNSCSTPATAALPEWFTFRSDNTLKFLATKDGKIYRVTITPGPPTGGRVIAKTASQPGESKQSGEPPAEQGLISGTATGETLVSEKTNVTQGPARDNSGVSGIAEQMAQALSSGDIDTLGSLYGDSVDYLDSGRISSDEVRSQIQEYFARWPVRQWTVTTPVKVESLDASVQKVTFSATYEVSNPQTKRHLSGTAKETMMVAADFTGATKIISHREKTSASADKSTKSDKHRREKIYDGRPLDGTRPIIPVPPNIPWPAGVPHP